MRSSSASTKRDSNDYKTEPSVDHSWTGRTGKLFQINAMALLYRLSNLFSAFTFSWWLRVANHTCVTNHRYAEAHATTHLCLTLVEADGLAKLTHTVYCHNHNDE